MKDGHCRDCGEVLAWDMVGSARARPIVCPACSRARNGINNVVPLRPVPPDRETVRERLYGLERGLLVALDCAQKMRRAYEDTGEIHHEGTGEALDRCAVWLAGVRDA